MHLVNDRSLEPVAPNEKRVHFTTAKGKVLRPTLMQRCVCVSQIFFVCACEFRRFFLRRFVQFVNKPVWRLSGGSFVMRDLFGVGPWRNVIKTSF